MGQENILNVYKTMQNNLLKINMQRKCIFIIQHGSTTRDDNGEGIRSYTKKRKSLFPTSIQYQRWGRTGWEKLWSQGRACILWGIDRSKASKNFYFLHYRCHAHNGFALEICMSICTIAVRNWKAVGEFYVENSFTSIIFILLCLLLVLEMA